MIRPCRESKTGWTPGAQELPGNQSPQALNERGPALNVFWIPEDRDWAPEQCGSGLPLGRREVRKNVTNKTEPEGARTWAQPGPAPFGSNMKVNALLQTR